MKLYHKAFLYRHKWIQPYLQKVLGGIDAVTFLAALALIGGVVYEHGFIISEGAEADLGVLYRHRFVDVTSLYRVFDSLR